MSYTRPLVMVFQEYAKMTVATQSATLAPCIIGPCYHLIDAEDDETLALVGAYTEAGFTSVRFPNNAPGALIDEASVRLRFKNPVAKLSATKIALTHEANVLTFDVGVYPTYAKVGDTVTLYDVTEVGSPVKSNVVYKVIGVNATTKKILLNKSVTGVPAAVAAEFYRNVPDFYIENTDALLNVDGTDESLSIVGVKVTIEGSERFIVGAECYITYRALRQDLSTVGTVYSIDECKAAMGKVDPKNPLAFGVSITLANTTIGVRFIGVDSDDVVGYTAAKDRLETAEDVYALVPLSQDPGILGMYKLHAEQMSKPEVGLWRVAIGSTKLTTDVELAEGVALISADGNGDRVVLKCDTASFLSAGVDAGDTLSITSGVTKYTYTVASVVAEDILTITQSKPFDLVAFPSDAPTATYAFVATKKLGKQEQAEYIRDTSKSYGSSRFVHVWPDVVVIDEVQQPGYYLACAVAGMTGGLASHQGFTRISIGGVDGLKHSNSYFNQSQLDTIADGGTFIFQQLTPTSAPYIRHQLTTEMSTIELREFSFVKNFDYVSIILKDTMDEFLGKWNITPQTLGVLSTALRSVMESLKLYTLPRIGSPVLGYEITLVKQHDSIRDRVEMYCEVDFPYPLNTIGLHVISR